MDRRRCRVPRLITADGSSRLLLIAIVAATLVVMVTAVEGLGCPQKCVCQQRTVRCVKQQLDNVPEMPPDTSIM
ncbi:AGAP007237-PA-like protein [Anopheles sinensis]|uniref:AGAP007237-PA-like protein n=1 Tax=Anopheles sinensis TaxID=74873 RepID=A0A084VQX5_ANOSI|nr:AGAP007237-PA-like protein [Anopheles sinensis]